MVVGFGVVEMGVFGLVVEGLGGGEGNDGYEGEVGVGDVGEGWGGEGVDVVEGDGRGEVEGVSEGGEDFGVVFWKRLVMNVWGIGRI